MTDLHRPICTLHWTVHTCIHTTLSEKKDMHISHFRTVREMQRKRVSWG